MKTWNLNFKLKIWRSEKRIALSEKKPPLTTPGLCGVLNSSALLQKFGLLPKNNVFIIYWLFRQKLQVKSDSFLQDIYLQVILFEIDCAILYTNLHELFCQFIIWTNWVNSGKFMDNCWISCQVMVDMEKFYGDLIIINLYLDRVRTSLWPWTLLHTV